VHSVSSSVYHLIEMFEPLWLTMIYPVNGRKLMSRNASSAQDWQDDLAAAIVAVELAFVDVDVVVVAAVIQGMESEMDHKNTDCESLRQRNLVKAIRDQKC
jgi:hypothetical protein